MDLLIADIVGDVALALALSAVLGAAARRCGQPRVIGQIMAGVLVGPSVLGRLPGHLASRLFPPAVLPSLTVLAQFAVVVFMFAVGYELDRRTLLARRRAASLVAAAAITVPMGLGTGLAAVFPCLPGSAGQSAGGYSFALFLGVVMAVTALPVLAAIVRDRGIAGTRAAVTATAAAGLMDAAAWLVLAVALTGAAHQQGRPWPATVLALAGFTAVMLLGMRPLLRWWLSRRQAVLASGLPVALTLALGSAWVTASLGLHPVFGGFLAGLTMPHADGAPDADILRPLEEIADLLLPLFFVVTGLSLNITGLDGGSFVLLAICCVIAGAGKLVPAYAAARIGGLAREEAATVAVLVNTRGLTELIALNVGLSTGLISQRLFSVLVLMALVMTVASPPLLQLVRGRRPGPPAAWPPAAVPPSASSEA